MAKDPYAVLGVEPGSTEQEIRAAYRQRARTEHPDINDAPNAEVLGGVKPCILQGLEVEMMIICWISLAGRVSRNKVWDPKNPKPPGPKPASHYYCNH